MQSLCKSLWKYSDWYLQILQRSNRNPSSLSFEKWSISNSNVIKLICYKIMINLLLWDEKIEMFLPGALVREYCAVAKCISQGDVNQKNKERSWKQLFINVREDIIRREQSADLLFLLIKRKLVNKLIKAKPLTFHSYASSDSPICLCLINIWLVGPIYL